MTPSETRPRTSLRVSRALLRVKPDRRLVQEQNLWPVEDPSREVQLLLHSPGELFHPAVGGIRKSDSLQDLIDPTLTKLDGNAEEVGEVSQILAGAHPIVEAPLPAEDEPDPRSDRLRTARHVNAEDSRLPFRGKQQGREDLGERGLPGPVRSQQPEQFALLDGEVHTVQRHRPDLLLEEEALPRLEHASDPAGLDRRFAHAALQLRTRPKMRCAQPAGPAPNWPNISLLSRCPVSSLAGPVKRLINCRGLGLPGGEGPCLADKIRDGRVAGRLILYIETPARRDEVAPCRRQPRGRRASPLPRAQGIPAKELPKVYRTMMLARLMDERCLSLQRQGRIGFYVPLQGQEGAQVGCAWALDPGRLAVSCISGTWRRPRPGLSLRGLFDQFIGNSGDVLKGRQMPNHYGSREHRFVTASSPVGTQISHAVGAAMAAQRKHDPIVTVTFFGDGTTSSNDFHAGLNFAGVFQTPTIFFCQNNQWAISMPRERQTHSKTLAMKAAAYGIEGIVVDGEDVHAVYRAVRDARARALGGKGPTLIEAQVYRLGPHSTSDDPKRYRTDAELAEWKARDSVARVRAELIASGPLSEETDAKLVESLKVEISAALKDAEATAPVEPTTLFDDVFESRTPRLEEERAQFSKWLAEGVLKQ